MSLVDAALVGWAAVAAAFDVVTAVRVAWGRRAAPERTAPWPDVVLLRPVDAPTPQERAHLAEPVAYPGKLTQWVLSPTPLAVHGEWIQSDPASPNRKVGHLLAARARLSGTAQVVLAVDADVRVDAALVQALVDAVARGAALATAAPAPEAPVGAVAQAVCGLLRQTHHSFVALWAMSAGAPAICGKALGFSPEGLAALDGLERSVGEDLERSRRLYAQGLPVVQVAAPARMPLGRVDGGAARRRFTRWMQVLRAHRPELFPTVPLLFAPTLLLAPWLPGWSLAALVATRTLLAAVLGGGPPLKWVAGEALLLAAFAGALLSRRVRWRERLFELQPGGEMRPVGEAP
jgi:hypothetical protein